MEPEAKLTDKGFTGHAHNDTIKLIDMKARWYSPQLGRFLQPDEIVPDPSDPQSLNRYSYAMNNPVKYRDPTGHYAANVNTGGNYDCSSQGGCEIEAQQHSTSPADAVYPEGHPEAGNYILDRETAYAVSGGRLYVSLDLTKVDVPQLAIDSADLLVSALLETNPLTLPKAEMINFALWFADIHYNNLKANQGGALWAVVEPGAEDTVELVVNQYIGGKWIPVLGGVFDVVSIVDNVSRGVSIEYR